VLAKGLTRVIDLDLLWIGDWVLWSEELCGQPSCDGGAEVGAWSMVEEIATDWMHPVLGVTVREC